MEEQPSGYGAFFWGNEEVLGPGECGSVGWSIMP